MFELKIKSPVDLEDAASQLLAAFPEQRIFAFYGELGVGKTTFIKALCRILKVSDATSSPSFGVIHEYLSGQGSPVYHFDFFRIETVEEVYDIGYEEYVYSGDYCFMEWPELLEALLPENTVRIAMNRGDDGVRVLQVQ